MDYKTGAYIKSKTVGNGIKRGEIIKILDNTFIISSGSNNYLVKKDEKNIKIINDKYYASL